MRPWLLIALAACGAKATPAPPVSPLAQQLVDDLATLRTLYETLHPGLYRYNTPAELDAVFAEARRDALTATSVGDQFVVLTRVTAAVRCGHSYPNFWNQSKTVSAAILEGPHVPFSFRWIGDELVVTGWLGAPAEALPPGTVVEAIGTTPARTILATLLPLARADGHNDAKRRAYLGVDARESFDAFDILAPLALGLWPIAPGTPSVPLTVRLPDGTRAERTVTLLADPAHDALVAARGGTPSETDPLWQLEYREHAGARIGYLRMPTWVAYKTTWDWQAALHATMRELAQQGTPALIVDLRGNEGGNDVGDVIVSHLIDQPLTARTPARRVRFERVPDALRPLLDTWDPSFYELGVEATPAGDLRELPHDDVGTVAPVAPRYGGKLLVLVDAANSSATFQFASTVRDQHLGTLVGTPTGGNQRGINGGAFFFATLPRTGIEVDVPLIGTFPAGSPADAGLVPDVLVETTAADIAQGRDPQLARALALATARP